MTTNPKAQIIGLITEIMIVLCLVVMFLASNDVWHDTGRPDFWRLSKPRFNDVRVFVCAYYVLVVLVLGRLLVRVGTAVARSRQDA